MATRRRPRRVRRPVSGRDLDEDRLRCQQPHEAEATAHASDIYRHPLAAASPLPWTIDGPTIKNAVGAVVCTWQISGRDPQPWHRADAEFIVRAANALERDRINELLLAWADYYNASTPVRQADGLLAFSNLMYHFGVEITGDITWTEGDTRPGAQIDVHADLRDEAEDGTLRHRGRRVVRPGARAPRRGRRGRHRRVA